MLAIRHAPEVALRRSRLHAQVVQLSLLVAAFRADALRMHSRVERRCMSEAALAHHKHIKGDGEKMRDVALNTGRGCAHRASCSRGVSAEVSSSCSGQQCVGGLNGPP